MGFQIPLTISPFHHDDHFFLSKISFSSFLDATSVHEQKECWWLDSFTLSLKWITSVCMNALRISKNVLFFFIWLKFTTCSKNILRLMKVRTISWFLFTNHIVNRLIDSASIYLSVFEVWTLENFILIADKQLSTITDLIETALKKLLNWAKSNCFGIDPRATEVAFFTRK